MNLQIGRAYVGAASRLRRLPSRAAARLLGSGVSVALLVVVMLLSSAQPSAAADPCAATSQVGFRGYGYAGPLQFEGLTADFLVRSNNLCDGQTTPGTNFNTAWVMVANGLGGGASEYAQVGFFRNWGGTTQHFTEWDRDAAAANFSRMFHGTAINGNHYRYWVQYVPEQRRFRLNEGTTILRTSTFDPYARWALPFSIFWSGEVIYQESDIPGTNGARTFVSDMETQWDNTPLISPFRNSYRRTHWRRDRLRPLNSTTALSTSGDHDAYELVALKEHCPPIKLGLVHHSLRRGESGQHLEGCRVDRSYDCHFWLHFTCRLRRGDDS